MEKIAYILTTYPCQSETFIQREITQLGKQGFEITIFASKSHETEKSNQKQTNICYQPALLSLSSFWSIIYTISRHPLRFVNLVILVIKLLSASKQEASIILFNLHAICFFANTIRKARIEHIHACFLSRPASIALGISILTKLPFSIAAHARDIFVEGGNLKLKAEKAQFISCCTRQGLDFLKNHIDSVYHHKLLLHYHGIEPELLSKKEYETKSSDFLIAVGRLVEKKGFVHLLEAFSKVAANHPNMHLIIAGNGPQKKQLQDIIEKANLTSKVYLAGWLDHKCVIKLIAQAKILIVPSIIDAQGDRDGIPNVVLEAFSAGTAVIASNLPGISEAVINEKTGILVEPGNGIQLAAAIEKLLNDESISAFFANNAKKMLADNFNIEKNCLAFAKTFEKNSYTNKKKIKIAHIVEGFVGGLSTYLCNVLVSLKKAGFDITLIYSSKRYDGGLPLKIEQLKEQGIKVKSIPMVREINLISDFYCLFLMIRIFLCDKFDIIHTHCSKAGAIGRIAAKLMSVNQIYHSSHCFAFLRCGNFFSKKIYLFAEKLFSRFTTKYIAVSTSDADSAIIWKIFDKNKCTIVNNGLPPKTCQDESGQTILQIRQSFNLPAESFVVVTACRLVEYKGLFTFLEAAKLCKSNAIFVIAGDGPLRQKIERYISDNSLSDKVKLVGYIYDMDKLYRICDLVVLCSTMEAQPYFVLEAMRANCTIIASDIAANRELLGDNRGVLVEPEPQKLAQAIDHLLYNNHKKFQLAQNAHDYFCSKHRLEDQVQKLINIYLDKERAFNIAD